MCRVTCCGPAFLSDCMASRLSDRGWNTRCRLYGRASSAMRGSAANDGKSRSVPTYRARPAEYKVIIVITAPRAMVLLGRAGRSPTESACEAKPTGMSPHDRCAT